MSDPDLVPVERITFMTEPIAPWHRFGYVIPHRHTDMDGYQFARVAPDGMMMVTTQLDLREYSLAAVEEQLPTLREAVGILADRSVHSLAISGVPLAASLGIERTRALLDELYATAGMRCSTDLENHILALQALGASRIVLGTRWPEALTDAIVDYLAATGITVVARRFLGRDLRRNKNADPLADHHLALALGRELMAEAPDAQAVLLPGGLWFAIHAARELEQEFAVPVLTNITSTVWAALDSTGEQPVVPLDAHWGRLFGTRAEN